MNLRAAWALDVNVAGLKRSEDRIRAAADGTSKRATTSKAVVRASIPRVRKKIHGFVVALLFSACGLAFGPLCRCARADSTVEISGAAGLGALLVGVTPGRFAIRPSASVSMRGERGFFVARDTLSFLGATGGRFGIDNETTLGGGLFWELVNASVGLSVAEYSLPICGPQRCGRVRGVAPGASARVDVFGPYLSGALGISLDCAGTWITGSAAPVWSGISVRCSAGPILRFTSRP